MGVDVVHFGAVAVWIGGLVVLGVSVLPRPPRDARAILARWSPVAMSAVAALVVTGSIQAWRELRSVPAFYDSTYGRWILVKVAGLLVLLALGEYGRRRVRTMTVDELMSASLGAALADRPDEPSRAAVASLRRSVGLELGLAAGVLAATSVLVVSTPGMHAGHAGHGAHTASAGPVSATTELPNQVKVDVVADPARAGSAVLTITVRTRSGDLIDPPEVDVTAALPDAGIAPITLSPVRAGAGRFTVDAASMLLPGTWTLTVTVRTTDVDAGVGTVPIQLAPA
jgi:copper transport protein